MSVLNYITLSHLKKVIAGISQRFKEIEDTVINKTTEIEKNVNTQLLEVNNHFQTVDKDIEDLKDGDYLDGKLITRGTGIEAEIFNGALNISQNIASGDYSHAEGQRTTASNSFSHSEGYMTTASGFNSHAEGYGTTASGGRSHAEGYYTKAQGFCSHASGASTTANGYCETVIGRYNKLSNANAQSNYNTANSPYILVCGNGSSSSVLSNAYTLDWSGNGTYAGKLTIGTAPTNNMDVTTKYYVDTTKADIGAVLTKTNVTSYIPTADYHPATKKYVDDAVSASETQSDWNENDTTDNDYILNKPSIKAGTGDKSIIEGNMSQGNNAAIYTIYITGEASATTFTYTTNDSLPSSLTGKMYTYVATIDTGTNIINKLIKSIDATNNTISFNSYVTTVSALTNAEVKIFYRYTLAKGDYSHIEGGGNTALGKYSHAEGYITKTVGVYSHAEGSASVAGGNYSHAEGSEGVAQGLCSHAEGDCSWAVGYCSHAEGQHTIASGSSQHVQGKYNIEDTNNIYADIVGNGGADNTRSNAYTLDWNGNGWYAGKLTVGTGPTANMDVATKKYVDDSIPVVPTKVSDLTNDSGFITFYTETDPIFVASAAHGITSSDITNWNSKTSLTLGTTSSTAFRGDYGQSAYTHAVTNKGSAFSSGLYKITTNSEGHVTAATSVEKSDITDLGIPAQDTTYTFDGTYNSSTNKAATVSTVTNAVSGKANISDVLTKTNTTSYTPSSDYNPATKKYVDDATAGITSNLSGLIDTTITTPTNGQLLRYNSTTSKWENVTLSLAISGNTIQLKQGSTVQSSITLPVYDGGVS